MTNQLALHLRDDGMARATEHAEAVQPHWGKRAHDALVDYLAARLDTEDFTAEDVREWATWVPEPPDRRAWGTVFAQAANHRLIRKVGYKNHRDPKRHHGVSTVWRRV